MRIFAAALFLTVSIFGAEPGFTLLFNGKDLSGWEQDQPGVWTVRDGMIVGAGNLENSDFLRTTNQYSDFILKVKFRLVNGQGNSGVEIRAVPVPDSHLVAGYQADVGGRFWGVLYDEARRNKILSETAPEFVAKLDKSAWHEYVITARGNHILVQLDGVTTADYTETDPSIPTSGIITLQVHDASDMEVQFRDIRIQDLR